MAEVGVIGGEEFLLGFRLAGVRNTFQIESDATQELKKIMELEKIGILVIDGETMDSLPPHFQEDLNKSVKPVVVMLSRESESSSLRDQIIRAIGVDLWKG